MISIHIIDHIYQWHQRWSLCKINLDDFVFLDWFLKYLLTIIVRDVSLEYSKTKNEAIMLSQQYDLIYRQSVFLYFIILDLPHPSSSHPNKFVESHIDDGVIRLVLDSHSLYGHPIVPSRTSHLDYDFVGQSMSLAILLLGKFSFHLSHMISHIWCPMVGLVLPMMPPWTTSCTWLIHQWN